MKVALFANVEKKHGSETLTFVSAYLKKRGVEVCLEQSSVPSHSLKELVSMMDCIISIGGDGSILHLVHHIGIPKCPLVGINLGSLGFLADIPMLNLESSLDDLCSGRYQISRRTVLRNSPDDPIARFAINEVAVHRGDIPHLIDLAIRVDDTLVNIFSADGVIISTPGGSTAYSLAAGGPIVSPDVPCLILTPICPHTISNRPIVLMPKKSISIELLNENIQVDVAFDGQKPFFLETGKLLTLEVSDQAFQLVSLYHSDFYNTVRSKLGWTGSLKRI